MKRGLRLDRDRIDRLLRLVLPPGDHGASIIGDLREEADARALAGEPNVELWYVTSALSIFTRYAWVRLRRWASAPVRASFLAPLERANPTEAWMGNVLADLRFALRVLFKTPQLSAVAILTIAIGVGLTTHTFSVVYGAILRGLPVPDDHQLVDIQADNVSRGEFDDYLSYPDYLAVKEQVDALSEVGGYTHVSINLAGDAAPPERLAGGIVTWDLLDVVGVPALLGRTFTEPDGRPGAPLTVVLSHTLWQNRFGSDAAVLGRTVHVNSEAATIIGVMPEGFAFPFDHDLWVAARFDTSLPRENADYLGVVGRLRDGVSVESADAELTSLSNRIAAEFPDTNEGWTFAAERYEEDVMPAEIRATMWAMLAAVFGVLVIACVNVANLLLARATLRRKEMAVRSALGASRWRVTRQLLIESGVLAFLGSALGLTLAYAGVAVFNGAIEDIPKPFWVDIRVDTPALVCTLLLTVVVALVAGLAPARRAAGVDVGDVLKDESRGSSGLHRSRFSSALVMVELAVSCALLVGAGLMTRSVINLNTLDLGFEAERLMTARVGIQAKDYPSREIRAAFFEQLQARLAEIPGVESAALTSSLPMAGTGDWNFAMEGEAYASDADLPETWGTIVSAGYFDVMGARWLEGRRFTLLDQDSESEPVIIVNRSFADRYFPDGGALDARLRLGRLDTTNPWMRIVGVVDDMQVGGGIGGIGSDRQPTDQVFAPMGRLDVRFMSLVVRTQGPPVEATTALRRAVADIDSNLPIFDVADMTRVIEQNTWAFGLFGSLFAIFGVVALFLAAVGLYGVMAFSVNQRQQEIGVRMALGARPQDIVRMVVRRGTVQLAIGLSVGLVLGWVLAKPLAVMLYGVDPLDPLVYGAIAVGLLGTGHLATFIPARAATKADPSDAMRA